MDENVPFTLSTVFDNSSKLRFTVIATARFYLFFFLFPKSVCLILLFVPTFPTVPYIPPIHGRIGGGGGDKFDHPR